MVSVLYSCTLNTDVYVHVCARVKGNEWSTCREKERASKRKRVQEKDTRPNGELVIFKWMSAEWKIYAQVCECECFYVHRTQSFWSTLHSQHRMTKDKRLEFCAHLIFWFAHTIPSLLVVFLFSFFSLLSPTTLPYLAISSYELQQHHFYPFV